MQVAAYHCAEVVKVLQCDVIVQLQCYVGAVIEITMIFLKPVFFTERPCMCEPLTDS